ncbi:MAG: hypothetical protein JO127_08435 [Caulobacteraceae bacterium]|nr:hypothetical protein [Caulobacteraceae bacterium]
MGQISEAKLELVRSLIEQAPDDAVRNLLLALSADGGRDGGLSKVQRMVECEASERRARNLTFAPVAPLCAPPSAFGGLRFPPRTLSLIWNALKAEAGEDLAAARARADDWRGPESSADVFDALCARVVRGLREEDPAFAPSAAAADAGAGRSVLALALEIAPLVRRALDQMPEWLGRMNSEKAAKLRLTYRDVVAVAEDAGPLFFEMLAAHLTEPWLILRIISGEMDRPNEAYVSGSELAVFGERVLSDIDRRLAALTEFHPASGPAGARAAAEAAHATTVEIAEVEQSINVSPTGPWGSRLARQKKTLAATVEAHLKAADAAVGLALPLQTVRLGPRTARGVPKLMQDPDPEKVAKATALLTFISEVRTSAAAGGFASARAKAVEGLEERLDSYVEDVLEEIRSGEDEHRDRARAFLDIAAGFCGLVRDEKAAQIVRRRAAAA